MAAALEMTVQDLPGRLTGRGVPRSGPMDPVAFSVANLLAGNDRNTEGLEIILVPGVPARLKFTCRAVVAITGREVEIKLNGKRANAWSRLVVPADTTLDINVNMERGGGGLRSYLAIHGGFPNVPKYLGSKSTSMGLGGYQACTLSTSLNFNSKIYVFRGGPYYPAISLPCEILPSLSPPTIRFPKQLYQFTLVIGPSTF
jgi:allophanate hydrolase subunit 2